MLNQAGLAQLVERAIRNRKVIGSTPIAGSIQTALLIIGAMRTDNKFASCLSSLVVNPRKHDLGLVSMIERRPVRKLI
jgi:hypothetical protein